MGLAEEASISQIMRSTERLCWYVLILPKAMNDFLFLNKSEVEEC
jgi:hypothetical protein